MITTNVYLIKINYSWSKMQLTLIIFLVQLIYGFSARANTIEIVDENGPELSVKTGSIKGRTVQIRGAKVYQFLGIPFAEPPVNELRFKRPVPKKSWSGVMNVDKWGTKCAQPTFPGLYSDINNEEDCLTLNVFVPEAALKETRNVSVKRDEYRPVMLWIHGGGFRFGSANDPERYDATALSGLKDVIVVTVNYRLGPLGFLYLPEAGVPGNMGLWDQQLAMKWVKDNIERFGGDPDRITIFGESAGGMSVSAHIVSPQSKGLFKNAIVQSGSIYDLPRWTIDGLGTQFLSEIKCTFDHDVKECLEFYKPGQSMKADSLMFWPVVGDEFLPEHSEKIVSNKVFDSNINVLLGTVGNEGALMLMLRDPITFNPVNAGNLTLSQARNILGKIFGKSLIKYYEDRYLTGISYNDSEKLRLTVSQAVGDTILTCPTYIFGRDLVNAGVTNVFAYYQSQKPSKSLGTVISAKTWLPATHFDDISMVFGYPFIDPDKFNQEDIILSTIMMDSWTNFARNGNPGQIGQQKWLSWSAKNITPFLTMDLNSHNIGSTNEKPVEFCLKNWPFPLEEQYMFVFEPGSLSGIVETHDEL